MGTLTQVRLMHVPHRLHVRLRFGRPIKIHRVDQFRRAAWFTPQALLALVHWQGNAYGTTRWWIAVLRTVRPGELAQTIEYVQPGAELLLLVQGSDRVQVVLGLVAGIERQRIAPIAVSPHYWRTVHNRLAARQSPPEYHPEQHDAHRRLQELLS